MDDSEEDICLEEIPHIPRRKLSFQLSQVGDALNSIYEKKKSQQTRSLRKTRSTSCLQNERGRSKSFTIGEDDSTLYYSSKRVRRMSLTSLEGDLMSFEEEIDVHVKNIDSRRMSQTSLEGDSKSFEGQIEVDVKHIDLETNDIVFEQSFFERLKSKVLALLEMFDLIE